MSDIEEFLKKNKREIIIKAIKAWKCPLCKKMISLNESYCENCSTERPAYYYDIFVNEI